MLDVIRAEGFAQRGIFLGCGEWNFEANTLNSAGAFYCADWETGRHSSRLPYCAALLLSCLAATNVH